MKKIKIIVVFVCAAILMSGMTGQAQVLDNVKLSVSQLKSTLGTTDSLLMQIRGNLQLMEDKMQANADLAEDLIVMQRAGSQKNLQKKLTNQVELLIKKVNDRTPFFTTLEDVSPSDYADCDAILSVTNKNLQETSLLLEDTFPHNMLINLAGGLNAMERSVNRQFYEVEKFVTYFPIYERQKKVLYQIILLFNKKPALNTVDELEKELSSLREEIQILLNKYGDNDHHSRSCRIYTNLEYCCHVLKN